MGWRRREGDRGRGVRGKVFGWSKMWKGWG